MGGKLFKSSDTTSSDTSTSTTSSDTQTKFVRVNRDYLTNRYKDGIMRIILIVALMCTWISALAAPSMSGGIMAPMFADFNSSRIAILVITFLAFFYSIFIFIVNFIKLTRLEKYEQQVKKWTTTALIIDVIFAFLILGISVTAAVRESQLSMSPIGINKGAYGTAAFFGFLSLLILIVIIVLTAFSMRRSREEQVTVPVFEQKTSARISREIPIDVYQPNNASFSSSSQNNIKEKSEVI